MTNLRDNEIQKFMWEQPINDVLLFEHTKADNDISLRAKIKAILPMLDKKPEGLEIDRTTYGQNVGHNMRVERLAAYAAADDSLHCGALTHEVLANDLAALLAAVLEK